MNVVPRTRTPIPLDDIPRAISLGFASIGKPLSPVQRANLAVLVAIETGQGASAQNHNLGNITASESYSGDAWRPPWFDAAEAAGNEKHERLHAAMLEGRAPKAFRAYPSREEGARDFARTIVRDFPEVFAAADARDPDAFRRALGKAYSRDYASNAAVTETIRKLQAKFGLTTAALATGVEASSALVVAGLLYLLWRWLR